VEYFILSQDDRIMMPSLPSDMIKALPSQLMRRYKPRELDNALAFNITSKPGVEYPAIMERTIFCLVNTVVKELFSKYDRNIVFTPVILNDVQKGKQHLYWVMDLPGVECLAPETEFHRDRSLKKIVLDMGKIRHKPIFKIGGTIAERLVIRLDVAESLLRRDTVYGIELTPVITN